MSEPHPPPGDAPPPEPREQAAPRRLSADEAAQLAGRVAELAAAGLPLAPGLRAAAAELPSGRLADALEDLAAGLDRGQTLDQALAAAHDRLPAHLRGLISAGVRSGHLGEVLEQFVGFRQFVSELRRSVWLTLAYPLLLVAITAALFVFLVAELAPLFTMINREMRLNPEALPHNVRSLQWFHDTLPMWLSVIGLGAVVLVMLYGLSGTARVRWLLNRLPALGPLWRFSGLAECTRLLKVLVQYGVALPEALRLTADGISDADVAAGCRRMAEQTAAGQSFSAALANQPQFTPIVSSVIAWGENHGTLADALESSCEFCVQSLRIWCELLRATAPAVLFMIIAAGVFSVVSYFQSLLSGLVATLSYASAPVSALNLRAQPLGALSLGLLGVALLVSLRLVYSSRRSGDDALHVILQIVARVLLAYAALGFFVTAAGGWGAWLWLAALVVWGMIVFRHRRAQQRMLTELLALAIRRGLPIQGVVTAFAAQQRGAIGRRTTELAERLRAGYPLVEAVRSTRRILSPQALVALEVGQQTDSLAGSLEGSARGAAAIDRDEEGLSVGLLGPFLVCTLGAAVVVLVALRIVPAFQVIYSDFHRPLPSLTQHLFQVLHAVTIPISAAWERVVESPWLEAILIAGSIASFLYFPLYKMGWFRSVPAPLNRLLAPRHTGLVLRWLAEAVRQGRPLQPTLALLGDRYPDRLTRRRLRIAASEVLSGADWVDSLRRRHLIRGTEAAILRAASRAGNLAWALDEAAAAAQRRLAYRLQWIGQVLLPVPILLLGGCVMLFAVGCLLPLIDLISTLAKV